jgi:hypothetical protein
MHYFESQERFKIGDYASPRDMDSILSPASDPYFGLVAIGYDGNTGVMRSWIDERVVEIQGDVVASPLSAANAMTFSNLQEGRSFNGRVGEIYFYNKLLTEEEFLTLRVVTKEIGVWPVSEIGIEDLSS